MTESLGRSSRRPRRRQRGPTSIARVRRGGRIAIVKGQDGSRWTDLYHLILTMSWGTFFVALAGCFLLLDIIFALLYFFSQGLANARPFSFEDCFIFSVQTLGSLSLGGIVPKSGFTKTIAVAEAFIGIVYLGLVTSLMYARFARPFARVLFSNVAIITVFDGTPTLMFRAANQRGNSILDAEAKVTLARRQVTREGIVMRRFEELKLARDRSSLFALSWTIMHRIDETSPLHGITELQMREQEMEVVVLLSGSDETLADRIYARHSYLPNEILRDRRFVDVLSTTQGGRRMVDLTRFHDTEPVEA